MRNPLKICWIRLYLRVPRTNSFRIPLTVADSTYILRNPFTIAESKTISYICLLRNPKQKKCADKIYVTGICARNPLKFCYWNLLTLWNVFKDLSLESRKIQTQNCVPIQCTVWPCNAKSFSQLCTGNTYCNPINFVLDLFQCWLRRLWTTSKLDLELMGFEVAYSFSQKHENFSNTFINFFAVFSKIWSLK